MFSVHGHWNPGPYLPVEPERCAYRGRDRLQLHDQQCSKQQQWRSIHGDGRQQRRQC